jgi:hypothetical protein
MPHSLLALFEMRAELVAIPLTTELNRAIGIIALDNDPISPLVSAVWSMTQQMDLDSRFNFPIGERL